MEAVKRCTPVRLPPVLYAYWRQVDVQIFSSVLPEEPVIAEESSERKTLG
jgi:hypothetical protein